MTPKTSHLSIRITKVVMNKYNAICDEFSVNIGQSIWDACQLGKTHKLPFLFLQ